MLREELLSNSETKKMLLNLVDLISIATIEIQESKNNIKILVSFEELTSINEYKLNALIIELKTLRKPVSKIHDMKNYWQCVYHSNFIERKNKDFQNNLAFLGHDFIDEQSPDLKIVVFSLKIMYCDSQICI